MGKGDNKVRQRSASSEAMPKELLFSTTNYAIIGAGLVLVIIGLFVMSGGHNGPDEWKAEEIYSFNRITLAPIIILTGLAVVVVAIFKNSGKEEPTVNRSNKEEAA